nr:MAG TPA: protein-turn-helix DNA binding protein [Caudoviricetes sp.]
MYNNLEAEIVRKKIKKTIIAKEIGKTYNTLNLKISGKYPFTYDEALIIHEKFFSECDFKSLFKKFEIKNVS